MDEETKRVYGIIFLIAVIIISFSSYNPLRILKNTNILLYKIFMIALFIYIIFDLYSNLKKEPSNKVHGYYISIAGIIIAIFAIIQFILM